MEPSRREEDNAARLELIVRIALLIAEFLVGLLF